MPTGGPHQCDPRRRRPARRPLRRPRRLRRPSTATAVRPRPGCAPRGRRPRDHNPRPPRTLDGQHAHPRRRPEGSGSSAARSQPRGRQRRHLHAHRVHDLHRDCRAGPDGAQIKRERITDSVTKRRAAGADLGGRRPTFTNDQIRNAQRLVEAGEPASHVARDLGMSRATLYRRIAALSAG